MWQQAVVYIIVISAALYAVWKLMRLIVQRNNPCVDCSGCGIKKELDRKRKECIKDSSKRKPPRSYGCGCS